MSVLFFQIVYYLSLLLKCLFCYGSTENEYSVKIVLLFTEGHQKLDH